MKSPNAFDRPWVLAITKLKERLEEPVQWYPFPAMIGFMLVMILGGHLLTDLNPRLGARVDVLPLDAPRHQDGGIWLGIYEDNGRINVVTSDRKKFSWPSNTENLESIEPLINYLKRQTHHESFSMALKMESSLTKITAVIAIDQRLKYAHLKPLIFALSSAKITRYGFETRIIN
ncbi:hypothetical protein [Pseudobacteriovorax antillogorgiicola]|uniref:Uncharacterized protein n=1 Tax=Pseudobacteriovorax antillogorgiicola TaxID=1513793 RepID=A0A1Y6B506_9BACT|nr:hypothetical protein [Pseudobacteriovorax antillogorgiicola]TCS59197.1 hypothetical protein EDD56_101100 [Pseudobacteriovorax antillogorgiicola]SME90685.1 hypothetical protein SAMN06296036_101386 [Pseudobacteriovorax antillogorgiicola]